MIRLENISKKLGQFQLKEINLEVKKNEYFIILGPTGMGKTITLETIAGIHKPDEGRVLVGGRDVTDMPARDRDIGMVYQDYMLFPHLTVRENIGFGLRFRGRYKPDNARKVEEIASLLHIDHQLHRYTGTLSGGEQQKTALARAVITEPQALLLDEPLSALDVRTSEKFRNELRNIQKRTGISIVHVTHNFNEAFALGHRLAVLQNGRVLQVGTADDILSQPSSEFVARFIGTDNLFHGTASRNGDVTSIEVEGTRILSSSDRQGRIWLSIKPEEIIVSSDKVESSALNSIPGRIRAITENSNSTIRLSVDCGLQMTAVITRHSYQSMQISVGSKVFLTFKASGVRIF